MPDSFFFIQIHEKKLREINKNEKICLDQKLRRPIVDCSVLVLSGLFYIILLFRPTSRLGSENILGGGKWVILTVAETKMSWLSVPIVRKHWILHFLYNSTTSFIRPFLTSIGQCLSNQTSLFATEGFHYVFVFSMMIWLKCRVIFTGLLNFLCWISGINHDYWIDLAG